MEKSQWRLIPLVECTQIMRIECLDLLRTQFDNVSEKDFASDLAEKEMMAILCTPEGVKGFSTLMTVVLSVAGTRRNIIFSGDTVVDPAYRNLFGLGQCLGRYFSIKRQLLGDQELWYTLISKGFGTYKAMRFLFRQFVPSKSFVHPEYVAVGKTLCAYKYPMRPLIHENVLVASVGATRLRKESADVYVPKGELGDFFRTHNPNYLQGDELVCVANADESNYTKQFQRVMEKVDG